MNLTFEDVSSATGIKTDYLTKVKMNKLPEKSISLIGPSTQPGKCYENAISACLELKGEYVAIGVVYIKSEDKFFEHSWFKSKQLQHFDSTYQIESDCIDQENEFSYFEMLAIPVADYLEVSEEIRGESEKAIDFRTLRESDFGARFFI